MPDPLPDPAAPRTDRRDLLGSLPFWFMTGGLVTGYGSCAAMGARYLFPAGDESMAWLFLGAVEDFAAGDSLDYRAPNGQRIAVARQNSSGAVEDFVALSSTCPHLGCQVHWESQNERFFCPCHNGVFDANGKGIAGPPGDAGQSLPRFLLRVQDGLLFIQVPIGGLVAAQLPDRQLPDRMERTNHPRRAPGAGHDPCLDGGVRPEGELT